MVVRTKMDLDQFQSFVEKNIEWFHGRFPEDEDSLQRFETALQAPLPASLRWLLAAHGYWHATGIDRLASIQENTLRCRASIALPKHILILADRGEGGVTLLDSETSPSPGEFRIIEVDATAVPGIRAKTPLNSNAYESYGQYALDCLEEAKDTVAPEWIAFNPSHFPAN